MSQISDIRNPWRNLLLSEQASFRGVMFHVESGGRSSGRRVVSHEYPKRNDNHAEDMGRQARRFQFSGYLVYKPLSPNSSGDSVRYDYVARRTELYTALEEDGSARLVHPVFCKGGLQAMCERFTMTESRERGGYTQFEMQFIEAGSPVKSAGTENPASKVASAATSVEKSALDLMPTDV
jgi:prophage DNA circulation protein